MKYIFKGYVVEGSTEHIMRVSHFGREFQLTGVKAALWLNGHGRFDAIDETNNIYRRELEHLRRMGLIEPVESDDAGEYRALTRCIIVPTVKERVFLSRDEKFMLTWLRCAGLHLTMAELVFLCEHRVEPSPELLGEGNAQALTERIYTPETIQDNALEKLMECAKCRDEAVKAVMSLLRKKLAVLLRRRVFCHCRTRCKHKYCAVRRRVRRASRCLCSRSWSTATYGCAYHLQPLPPCSRL